MSPRSRPALKGAVLIVVGYLLGQLPIDASLVSMVKAVLSAAAL